MANIVDNELNDKMDNDLNRMMKESSNAKNEETINEEETNEEEARGDGLNKIELQKADEKEKEDVNDDKGTITLKKSVDVEDSDNDKINLEKSSERTDLSELTLSEGSSLSKKDLSSLKEVGEQEGLTLKQAKATLDFVEKHMVNVKDKEKNDRNKLMAQWDKQVYNDPDLGRGNIKETERLAQMAINKLLPMELQKIIVDDGYYRNPDVLRFLKQLGQSTISDSYISEARISAQPKEYTLEQGNQEMRELLAQY